MTTSRPGAPVLVGTSGWVYAHWRPRFYPEGMGVGRWLGFLASRVASVEVNATFYSLTTPRACDRWRASVSPEFVFAVKGSRYVTHMKRLQNADAAMANFFASGILRLGSQLGPILWQLPSSLPFERSAAGRFFERLPRDIRAAEWLAKRHDARVSGRAALQAPDGRDRPVRYALEPRHESWMSDEAGEFLARHRVARVWADTAGEHPATTRSTTTELAYVRLHGSQRIYEGHYTDAELDDWARRASAWSLRGTPVYVYFDNDRDAAAAIDAQRLRARFEGTAGGTAPFAAHATSSTVPEARPRPSHFGFARRRASR